MLKRCLRKEKTKGMVHKVFVVGWILGALALPLHAVTFFVNNATGNDTWNGLTLTYQGGVLGPKATIQAGINAAAHGDRVIVANGTYTGTGNRDIDFLGKNIYVYSMNGAANTIIDAQQAGRGFYFHSGETADALVAGFTITGGAALRGGAIYCSESSPSIFNCIITGNVAGTSGGAIYCQGAESGDFTPTIAGNIITGNQAAGPGGGIHVYFYNMHPIIQNNLIAGNHSDDWGGGISVFSAGADARIINNTIVDNRAFSGGGISLEASEGAVLRNLIVWNNTAGDGQELSIRNFGCVYLSAVTIDYNNISAEEIVVDADSVLTWCQSNIDFDPLFAAPGHWDNRGTPADLHDDLWVNGDYHLKSTAGRWLESGQQWLNDTVVSPCIDTGCPGSTLDAEPAHAANLRINMGAYGGTAQASKTPAGWSLLADLTNDGIVSINDYSLQLQHWLFNDDQLPGDLNRDQLVDVQDVLLLMDEWLATTSWNPS